MAEQDGKRVTLRSLDTRFQSRGEKSDLIATARYSTQNEEADDKDNNGMVENGDNIQWVDDNNNNDNDGRSNNAGNSKSKSKIRSEESNKIRTK